MKYSLELRTNIMFETEEENKEEMINKIIDEITNSISNGKFTGIECKLLEGRKSLVKDSDTEIIQFYSNRGDEVRPEDSFTKDELERLDEIDNATHEYCKTMLNKDDLLWDMSMIGEVADMVSEILIRQGWKVPYPSMVENKGGTFTYRKYF